MEAIRKILTEEYLLFNYFFYRYSLIVFSTNDELAFWTKNFSSFFSFSTVNSSIILEITSLNFSGEAVATPTTGRLEEKEVLDDNAVAVCGSIIQP